MSTFKIHVGDSREILRSLDAGSVQTCITSPPYFGLRDYGNDAQMGLETTPDEYVKGMVGLFSEVWRVLKDDGTLWLNLGDTYSTGSGGGRGADAKQQTSLGSLMPRNATAGIADKNLLGIPWRVAFALQAEGWYLRQDIIWAKPNPMPESVTDRCTKSHEYLFLLSKSARYFYDHEAIKEPSIYGSRGSEFDTGKTAAHQNFTMQPRDRRAGAGRLTYDGKRQGNPGEGQEAFVHIEETRNKRDVWTIPTTPFKGAHFAVMPEALVEPCVLAGSREGDTVLDPFAGSGTVGVVALRHQRNFVGVELNPAYAEMARARIKDDGPMLNEEL